MQATGRPFLITLERATSAQADDGQEIQTWATLATAYASWRRATARETLASAEVSASVTDIFETLLSDAYDDLSPLDRLQFNGRTYDISDVQMIGFYEGLRIAAVARGE